MPASPTSITAPSPTAAVKPPAPKPVAKPVNPLATGARPGFDVTRPFRVLKGLLGGVFNGTLDGTASWGRRGMWTGLGLALLACLGGFSIPLLMMGAVGGLVVGATAGGGIGLVTGAVNGVGRSLRAEKYADDVAIKQTVKATQSAPSVDYRAAYRQQQHNSTYALDRLLQNERETRMDERRYWQDHVEHSRGPGAGGREF